MSSPVSESVSCMIGPSVNALLPGFVVIRLLMTGYPSNTDVMAAKSVDLVPDPQPDVEHRTGYFTAVSSALVVGFDMVLVIRYNADGWVSVLEDCGYCFELSTIQYNTVQYSTVQCGTVQYGTVQYSTVQYSTVF